MADDKPTDPAPAAPSGDARADPQPDPLADELLKMGSFDDAPADSAAAGGPDLAELQELLKQAGLDQPASAPSATAADHAAADHALADRLMAEAASARGSVLPATTSFDLPAFESAINAAQASSIDLLRDVDLNVKIELGRSRMLVEDVLKLVEGSVVELDKLAGDPVDVFVNDRLVARGEVLVLNDNFCVRVNEIVAAVRDDA